MPFSVVLGLFNAKKWVVYIVVFKKITNFVIDNYIIAYL